MDGARGNALEWALALLHAPGERHALRQRPLPGGMHTLLGIAAGTMSDASAEAARTLGEPEARLREAAQFYAREVLFHPRADAYRVLGVDRNAGAEQIKAHHRLLQLWLHPDRLQGEDDAIFAARVNAAWNHLRSEDRRKAYDAQHQPDDPSGTFALDGAAARGGGWAAADVAGKERWRYRMPVIALSVVCVALGWLVVRDGGDVKDAWTIEERQQAPATEMEEAGFTLPQQIRGDHVRHVEARPGGVRRKAPLPPTVAPDAGRAIAVSQPAQPARKPDLAQVRPPVLAKPLQTPALPAGGSPFAARVERQAESDGRSQSQSTPSVAREAVRPAASSAAQTANAVAVPAVASMAASAPVPPDFARIQSVRKTGEQLLRYMAKTNGPAPPIWNSPAIQSSADQLRTELHQAGKVELAPAQWRIGSEAAALTSAIAGEGGMTGRVTADLVWREGQWLVTGVGTERAR